jgi:hypothetical protein
VEYKVVRRRPHDKQRKFIYSPAKRKIIRAGRRSGKTTGIALLAIQALLDRRRVLYATPTSEQVGKFWFEVVKAFQEPIKAGALYKNESRHIIELPNTEVRIRAKTAWNAATLRGDYADVLIFDEWQLMNEDAWGLVGAPMLLDNNGDAVFIYTPPSLRSRSVTKADDPRHAAKLFKRARADESGRWGAFHFTSYDNPYISEEAIDEARQDMTHLAFRQEILAEDIEEIPGALWTRKLLETCRPDHVPRFSRIVIGVDPAGGAAENGIIIVGKGVKDGLAYVIGDKSLKASPNEWGRTVVKAYHGHEADRVVAETNFGGDMVEHVIRTVDPSVSYKSVRASRGKAVRAEPIAALYEQGKVKHVVGLDELEDEMCSWVPDSGMDSPNRMDALVWALTELMLEGNRRARVYAY